LSKPTRRHRARPSLRVNPLVYMTSSILAASAASAADQPPPVASGALEEVIVTAQKHAENLQAVPISIQAIDTKKLAELQVNSFDGYAKFLPSLSVQSFGPGYAQLYIRGVSNGGDGLHVGSQPLVGVYVDEMPVTTIASNLDVHIYDMARVEALSGPQGTLYGSSSMAGTLRLITNKASTSGFEAGYDLTANTFTGHGVGGKIEGFVNIPLNDHAAVRLVAFSEHDGGYISNVLGPPETYPTSGVVRSNAGATKKDFNDVQTSGGRATATINFADHWTITPTVMAQTQRAPGIFAYEPAFGDLNTSQYTPDTNTDNWMTAALTVEGKIGDFDVVYAGGLMNRNIHLRADYSDYSYFYDTYYHASPSYFGSNFKNNAGDIISPQMYTISSNNYKKYSHELRLSTPKTWTVHGVLGAFLQRQYNYARDEYHVDGLADDLSLTNLPGVLYLNSQRRTDRDKAVFTDWTWDVTSQLALTGGIREFKFDNTVYGFFGYNGQPTGSGGAPHGSGEQLCFAGTQTTDSIWPCANINSRATNTGETHRLNVTYKFDPDHMIYATWSTGFRPGGVNRVRTRPPYGPDYLTNVEAGWKTEWFDRRIRFNGAVFTELWKGAQYALIGENGITEITNAGRSRITGVESDITWRVTDGLTVTASGTALHTKLLDPACDLVSSDPTCATPAGNSVLAPAGSRLPVSAKLSGNVITRYEFKAGDYDAHVQGALVAKSDVIPALTVADAQATGNQPGYATFDLATGLKRGNWEAELFVQNVFDNRGQGLRYTECAPSVCSLVYVVPVAPRLVGVTFGQKF
jgi:outer membrane receptor protein involved in Fe transport